MRVALVYDRVNKIGGAERVLLALHEIWPEAPLFTTVYNPQGAPWAAIFDKIIPSFMQKIPLAQRNHEFFPWLTPIAFESFNFKDYDIIISVTSAEAKCIINSPKQLHVCYCLTPTRYLWFGYMDYWQNPGFGKLNFLAKGFFWLITPILRIKDQVEAQRPDYFLAISREVQRRIGKYYRRASKVVYPPVEINKFRGLRRTRGEKPYFLKKPYFLMVSRLVPYKNVDLVIKVFNELGWSLKIIGTGRELNYLKKIAKSNSEFLGEVSDEMLIDYYQSCQALIMAAEEDFGIIALEAQAAGKPVIAYKRGGVLETVIENKTGLFFDKLRVKDLKLALNKFKGLKFKPSVCQKNARRFAKEIFIKKFKKFMEDKWEKFQKDQ